jgi:hypothetical protein
MTHIARSASQFGTTSQVGAAPRVPVFLLSPPVSPPAAPPTVVVAGVAPPPAVLG